MNIGCMKKFIPLFDFTALPKAMYRNKSLLWQMTKRNIEARYRGSALGLLWSFVQPLIMLAVYTFVFSWLMGAKWGIEGADWGEGVAESKTAFAIIMFCGLTVFNLFSESITSSCTVIVSSSNLVKKVVFPLEVLPLSQVLSVFVLGLAWVVILFVGVALFFGELSLSMLLLPLVLLPLIMISLGVSYFVASLGVYLRDTQYIVNVMMQLLFWAVPIVYPLKLAKDKIGDVDVAVFRFLLNVIEYNPLTVLVDQTRMVFVFGRGPDWIHICAVYGVAVAVLQMGYFWFIRTRKGFSDVI